MRDVVVLHQGEDLGLVDVPRVRVRMDYPVRIPGEGRPDDGVPGLALVPPRVRRVPGGEGGIGLLAALFLVLEAGGGAVGDIPLGSPGRNAFFRGGRLGSRRMGRCQG